MAVDVRDFENSVLAEAARLRALADRANEIASIKRQASDFPAAELFDRRAEALRCAAALAESRGVMA